MGRFDFKQFSVCWDNNIGQGVGTDAVLLGAWVDLKNAKSIIDIGTGTGVIALMAAQRCEANIVGVDIESEAIKCAKSNFENSKWSNRLSAIHSPIQQYQGQEADVIISNPPYFVDSLISPFAERTTARHTSTLSFIDLTTAVERLLTKQGQFSLILPPKQMGDFCRQTKLYMQRRCEIVTSTNKEPKRIMATFGRNISNNIEEERVIICGTDGSFTEQYRDLTKDFYLKF